jgi:ketosteroid isomerase-like protein
MSQETITVVRNLYGAVARRDEAAIFACYDPDVEWHDNGAWLDVGSHRGFGGVRAANRAFFDEFERVEFEPYDLVDVGDRVLVNVHVVGRRRESGVEVEREVPVVFEIHDAKIARVDVFADRALALEALGQRE